MTRDDLEALAALEAKKQTAGDWTELVNAATALSAKLNKHAPALIALAREALEMKEALAKVAPHTAGIRSHGP